MTELQLGFQDGDALTRSLVLPVAAADSVATATELWRAAVDRRVFLASATFATAYAVESVIDWRFAPARADIAHDGNRQVTDADVEQVRQTCAEFDSLDRSHGGGYALGWLEQYLAEEVGPLLNGRYSDQTGRELFRTAAALTNMAGWMSMDWARHGLGQRMYTQAAGLAKHAGDTAFGAYVYDHMATQALFLGHTRTAVRLARAARDGGGKAITPTLTARIAITEARAHALLGDAYETRRTLRIADAAISRSNPDTDPGWLGTLTTAHYAGGVMHALRDLGDVAGAEAHADEALDLPPANARTRALHTVLYASVLAGRGELDSACHIARTALETAVTLKSKRLNQRLGEFATRVAAHRDVSVVADYLDASRSILPGAIR